MIEFKPKDEDTHKPLHPGPVYKAIGDGTYRMQCMTCEKDFEQKLKDQDLVPIQCPRCTTVQECNTGPQKPDVGTDG